MLVPRPGFLWCFQIRAVRRPGSPTPVPGDVVISGYARDPAPALVPAPVTDPAPDALEPRPGRGGRGSGGSGGEGAARTRGVVQEQPQAVGGGQRLGAVRDAQLAEDAVEVGLDRGLPHVEPSRDAGRALGLGDELQHLLLAPGEPGTGPCSTASDRARQAGRHEGPWRACGAVRGGHDLGPARLLRQERRGPGLQRGQDRLVAAVHREHHQPHRVAGGPQPSYDVEAAAVGQLEVGDHDVGREHGRHGQALGHRAGLAHDLVVAGALEDPREALPDQLVVIDQQHTHGRLPCRWSRGGRPE